MYKFEIDPRFSFLMLAGIPHGFITIKPLTPKIGPILHIEAGEQTIDTLYKKRLLNNKQAKKLRQQMKEAKLLKNLDKIIAAFNEFKIPEKHTSKHKFERCQCKAPFPHGNVVDSNNGNTVMPIFSMDKTLEGLFSLHNLINPIDAVIMVLAAHSASVLKDEKAIVNAHGEDTIEELRKLRKKFALVKLTFVISNSERYN